MRDDREPAPSRKVERGGSRISHGVGDWQWLGEGESDRGSIHTCLQCCEVQVSSELLSMLLQILVIAGITCKMECFCAALLRWGKAEAKDSSICINPD